MTILKERMSPAKANAADLADIPEPRVGNWVYWYSAGLMNNAPSPALVVRDTGPSRVCVLNIFTESGVTSLRSVRHYSDATNHENLARKWGAWSWDRVDLPDETGTKRKKS